MSKMRAALLACLVGLVGLAPVLASADPVADFYAGKRMRFIVRTPPGGDYDITTRLLARFWGKHIPGHPSFIVQNMPGGGGIRAANYLANIAPKDGTVVEIVGQGLAVDQALHLSKPLTADLRKFNWIANVTYSNQLLVVWHTSPTKTLAEAKKRVTTIGATGAGSASVQYPTFYNNVLGTKFKIVPGYAGGQLIDAAMQRGEVEGRGTNPYSGYMASKPTWIPDKLIIPLVQVGEKKEPALPNVPLLLDQQPLKPQDKPLLQFMSRAADVGRPLATTPGVPAARVAALRTSFEETLKDPAFIAAAKREHVMIRPMSAERIARLIDDIIASPADVRARVKAALEPNRQSMIK